MPPSPAGTPTGTAAILFTNLSARPRQRTRLGEEAADALLCTHDRLLAAAVAAPHGTNPLSTLMPVN